MEEGKWNRGNGAEEMEEEKWRRVNGAEEMEEGNCRGKCAGHI